METLSWTILILIHTSPAIYDNRIEISSPGQFPRQITTENIKLPQESFPHNLNVAQALFRMTYLENWDSGVKHIIDACRAQNVEETAWSDMGGFITVTFKRPMKEPSENYDPQNGKDNSGNTNLEGQKSSNDPLNASLGGQDDLLNAVSDPLKRLLLSAIMEDKSIT